MTHADDAVTQYLIQRDYITRADLTTALEYQTRLSRSQSMDIEEVLVAMEYINEDQLDEARRACQGPVEVSQDKRNISQAAYYAAGYEPVAPNPTPTAAAPSQTTQNTPAAVAQVRPEFEKMLADLGLATGKHPEKEKPEDVLRARLGELLLEREQIAEWQLMHALCMQRDDPNAPQLGTLLVQLGYVSKEVVAHAINSLRSR